MVYAEKLANRIRILLKKRKKVTEKKMFGGIVFLLSGKMFCGVIKNDLVVRTGLDYYKKALTKPHTRPMDFTGRVIKGFVYVDSDGCKTDKILLEWINLSIDFVISLHTHT